MRERQEDTSEGGQRRQMDRGDAMKKDASWMFILERWARYVVQTDRETETGGFTLRLSSLLLNGLELLLKLSQLVNVIQVGICRTFQRQQQAEQ